MTYLSRVPSLLLLCVCGLASGQQRAEPVTAPAVTTATSPQLPQLPQADKKGSQVPAEYVLGADDQLVIWAPDLGDISGKPINIGVGGFITLPMVGRVQASGVTAPQLEAEIVSRLHEFVREPQVVVTISQFRSQPVSVLGAVNTPGVHQLEGRKTLVEMLSLAGGLKQDAGYKVKISRSLEWGRIPLPNAQDDSTHRFSVAEVSLNSIMNANNPAENVLIRPHDVISVPRARLVYVIGDVTKAGGFVLEEKESMSVLQALSLAGGLMPTAATGSAKILRDNDDPTKRKELPLDVKKILQGKMEDVRLKSDDILFIPSSTTKKAGVRAAQTVVEAMTGIVIWRGGHP